MRNREYWVAGITGLGCTILGVLLAWVLGLYNSFQYQVLENRMERLSVESKEKYLNDLRGLLDEAIENRLKIRQLLDEITANARIAEAAADNARRVEKDVNSLFGNLETKGEISEEAITNTLEVRLLPILTKRVNQALGGYGIKVGISKGGQRIGVPWGTTDDWQMIVSPKQLGGWEENEKQWNGDNAIISYEYGVKVVNETEFEIVANGAWRLGQSLNNIHDPQPVSAHYILIPKHLYITHIGIQNEHN